MLGVRPRSRSRPLLLAVLVGFFGIFFSLTWYSDSAALRMTGAAAQTAPGGALGRGDVRRAIESLIWLGNFYATLAKNDPNRYAAEFWLNMADTYRRAGLALSDLEARGAIRVEDLTGGAASKLEAGAIVLDRRLGGPWQN